MSLQGEPVSGGGATQKAIEHHYDVGRDFYRLWLDARMVYSCALWPAELDDSVGLVQHRLSSAAQIFKGQALAAAAVSVGSIDPTETFRSGLLAWPSVAADLIPAS